MVKKAIRYLGLFLASMVSLLCMPSVAWADDDVFRGRLYCWYWRRSVIKFKFYITKTYTFTSFNKKFEFKILYNRYLLWSFIIMNISKFILYSL